MKKVTITYFGATPKKEFICNDAFVNGFVLKAIFAQEADGTLVERNYPMFNMEHNCIEDVDEKSA